MQMKLRDLDRVCELYCTRGEKKKDLHLSSGNLGLVNEGKRILDTDVRFISAVVVSTNSL